MLATVLTALLVEVRVLLPVATMVSEQETVSAMMRVWVTVTVPVRVVVAVATMAPGQETVSAMMMVVVRAVGEVTSLEATLVMLGVVNEERLSPELAASERKTPGYGRKRRHRHSSVRNSHV